uniref:RING-type domain-containing protein n=1 Tax=Macrostomum lignano TaxID=282301 RepID=A0A1I8GNY8_9PLAT
MNDFGSEVAEELLCPVCLDPYNDPVYVCIHHHSLCRECYQMIVSTAGSDIPQCPQCREKLTRPVDNTQLRRLVEAHQQQSQQAVQCQDSSSGGICARRSAERCGHCEQSFCAQHFIAHKEQFQTDCVELLSAADEAAQQSEIRQRVLTEWEVFIQSCVAHLIENSRLQRLIPESWLDDASRRHAEDLRSTLNAGDLRAARVAYDELRMAKARFDQQGPPREIVGELSRDALFSLFQEKLSALLNEAEQVYLDGIYGLVERVCHIGISTVKLKIGKEIQKIPELKCRLSFVLPGRGSHFTPYVDLKAIRAEQFERDILIRFDFQQQFDYSTISMSNGLAILAQFLQRGPIELPFCLQMKFKERLASGVAENTYCSRMYQLAALLPLAEAISRGESIENVECPLLDENEAPRGCVTVSTNLPCLLNQVYRELPAEEQSEVELRLRGEE